jgi:hypothetical protein
LSGNASEKVTRYFCCVCQRTHDTDSDKHSRLCSNTNAAKLDPGRRTEQAPKAVERGVPVTLVEAYKRIRYNFSPADPIEAMRFRIYALGQLSKFSSFLFKFTNGRELYIVTEKLHYIGFVRASKCLLDDLINIEIEV